MSTLPPLTHHEIMALMAPFARCGRPVDLAGSDRLQRRLAFKPVLHEAQTAQDTVLPAIEEQLQLDNPWQGSWRLTRTLQLHGGLQATLVCEGTEPADLLATVLAVPLQRQVQVQGGAVHALSHRVAAGGQLVLTAAAALLPGLRLDMAVSRVSGIPAELELSSAPGEALALPEDLLAVLGLAWSRLTAKGPAWRSTLKLKGQDTQRSQDAETKLALTTAHLAQTLAEPPARFHERHLRQRWLMVLRRLTPLGVALALMGAAALVPQLELGPDSAFRMLIFNSPPLLLAALFSMRELPRLELRPPLPRVNPAPDWRAPPPRPSTRNTP